MISSSRSIINPDVIEEDVIEDIIPINPVEPPTIINEKNLKNCDMFLKYLLVGIGVYLAYKIFIK